MISKIAAIAMCKRYKAIVGGFDWVVFGFLIIAAAFFIGVGIYSASFDHFSFHAPGTNFWGAKEKIKLLKKPIYPYPLIEIFSYCLFALLIGWIFLKHFITSFAISALHLSLLLLAGFVPGYLILIAINRMVTLILPNDSAIMALLILYGGISGFCLLNACTTLIKNCKKQSSRVLYILKLKRVLTVSSTLVVVVIIFLVSEVEMSQPGPLHVVGDGSAFFLNMIKFHIGFDHALHFPIITQHYDEIMFLYPVIELNVLEDAFNSVDWYWMMYAFGRASCFAISILSISALSNSRLLAWLITLFIFIGSIHPNPLSVFQLFDSASPLIANTHIARVILCVIPIMIMALGAKASRFNFDIVAHPVQLLLLILVSIGIAAFSFHFIIVVGMGLVMAASMFFFPPISLISYTVASAIITIIVLYSSPTPVMTEISLLILCFLANSAILGQVISRYASKRMMLTPETKKSLKNLLLWGMIFVLYAGLGLFFGNLFVIRAHNLLGISMPYTLTRPFLALSVQFHVKSFCTVSWDTHCKNLTEFIRFFGLPFVLAGTDGAFMLYRYKHGTVKHSPYAWSGAISLTLLIFSFFVWDFLNAQHANAMGIWIKSRLPEPWFYSCIVLSIINIWSGVSRNGQYVIGLILVGFIFLRHLLSAHAGIFGQLIANAAYLVYHLSGV